MKEYPLKGPADPAYPLNVPATPPRGTTATLDAMLDKMGELIRTRDAWANLAKLLLVKGDHPKDDPELEKAFRACFLKQ
jgi:hypothetical protein